MRPVRKADNLTTILGHCHVIWEPQLSGTLWALGPVMGLIYLYLYLLMLESESILRPEELC